jgi:hypothetical protein
MGLREKFRKPECQRAIVKVNIKKTIPWVLLPDGMKSAATCEPLGRNRNVESMGSAS